MSYTITLDNRVLASGETENVIVLTDTSGTSSQEVAVAVDYSNYYKRIADAIETIALNSITVANNSTTIANNSTIIANNSTIIAQKVKTIESHLNSFDTTYQITISGASGRFLEDETVTDSSSNSARVVKHFENTLIVDSFTSLFTGTTLTGSVSGTTASIANKLPVKNFGKEITEFNRQEDVYRLILKHDGTNVSRSVVYNRDTAGSNLEITSPGNISINEKDRLTLTSSRTGFATSSDPENLYITRIPNPTVLADNIIENDNISGQGTRSITWNTTYADQGTYYWYTESRSRSGTITINYKGYRIDEKITGANGGVGYVRSYTPISDVDLRIIDIQAISKDFSIDEVITSEISANTSSIDYIIKINAGSGGSSGSSARGLSSVEAYSLAALYKLYVENGEILSTADEVSPAEQAQAIQKISQLIRKAGIF